MKIKTKMMLINILFPVLTLIVLMITFSTVQVEQKERDIVNTVDTNLELLADMIGHEIHHFITLTEAISTNDLIDSTLTLSNNMYGAMEETTRNTEIDNLNETWKNTTNEDDPFIQSYLTTSLSIELKNIASNESNYFGEIFVTNKYGLVVGTSGRLTTIAHSHKYWWEGAYNDGDLLIYIDDRGYDSSVDSIVIGIVIPITDDQGEFVGMIKSNFLIDESLSKHLHSLNDLSEGGEYLITRSNGLIISSENTEPLSESIDENLVSYFNEKEFIGEIKYDNSNAFFGSMCIELEIINKEFIFGGSDTDVPAHSLGNPGGYWKAIYIEEDFSLNEGIINAMLITIIAGLVVLIITMTVNFLFSNSLMSKIDLLRNQTAELTKGNYGISNSIDTEDEIGELSVDINALSRSLKLTTTSIENYQEEIKKREKLEIKLLKASRFDELTELYNRRAFKEYFTKFFSNAKRFNHTIGFIIFDIDNFKRVNDKYGHVQGDEVLKEISMTVKKTLRSGDVFCRWGGEEFVILTPNITKENIMILAEKIRKVCETLDLQPVPYITISLGATVSQKEDTLDSIIKRADQALYKAKEKGKNTSAYKD